MYLILSLLFLTLPIKANQELFNQANHHYKEQEYERAYELYEQIEPKNAVVWINMGNVAYRKEDYLHSLICWERALRVTKSSRLQDMCHHNIGCAKKALGVSLPQPLYKNIYLRWFIVLMILAILAYLVYRCIVKREIKIALVITFLLTDVMAYRWYNQSKRATEQTALTTESTHLYAGPDTMFHVLAQVPSVSYCTITDTKNSWYKVSCLDTMGWISMDAVEVI